MIREDVLLHCWALMGLFSISALKFFSFKFKLLLDFNLVELEPVNSDSLFILFSIFSKNESPPFLLMSFELTLFKTSNPDGQTTDSFSDIERAVLISSWWFISSVSWGYIWLIIFRSFFWLFRFAAVISIWPLS